MSDGARHPASFRDPSGFLFHGDDGALYRQVEPVYAKDYEQLVGSGLYAALVDRGWLVAHEEVDPARAARAGEGVAGWGAPAGGVASVRVFRASLPRARRGAPPNGSPWAVGLVRI